MNDGITEKPFEKIPTWQLRTFILTILIYQFIQLLVIPYSYVTCGCSIRMTAILEYIKDRG